MKEAKRNRLTEYYIYRGRGRHILFGVKGRSNLEWTCTFWLNILQLCWFLLAGWLWKKKKKKTALCSTEGAFLGGDFYQARGRGGKHILLRDWFGKIACNFVMKWNAPDHRGCTFGVHAFWVRGKKIDKNQRNQPECGQKEHGICSYCSVRSIRISGAAGGRRSERVGDSLASSFSFVLPPTEEHWYWRLSGASSLFSHALAALTVMKRMATVGRINNSAWIFHQICPSSLNALFFFSSSHSSPLFPPLWLAALLFALANTRSPSVFCHARFNSVTYGVLRGTSACLTCRFGSAWLPVSVFPGTDLVFFFCDGEFILFYLRLHSLSELHQCRTFPSSVGSFFSLPL